MLLWQLIGGKDLNALLVECMKYFSHTVASISLVVYSCLVYLSTSSTGTSSSMFGCGSAKRLGTSTKAMQRALMKRVVNGSASLESGVAWGMQISKAANVRLLLILNKLQVLSITPPTSINPPEVYQVYHLFRVINYNDAIRCPCHSQDA